MSPFGLALLFSAPADQLAGGIAHPLVLFFFSSGRVRSKRLTCVSVCSGIALRIDFFFPHQRLISAVRRNVCSASPPPLKLKAERVKKLCCNIMLAVGVCEGKVAVVQLRPAAFAAQLSLQTKKSRFSPYLFFVFSLLRVLDASTCRWWAWTLIKSLTPEEALKVRAKVASLEALKGQRADLGLQRPWEGNYLVSQGGGAAQSSHLFRKCVPSRVLGKCDANVTLVSAEARQPRRGFLVLANYQRAAAERQVHASSVFLQRPQGEGALNQELGGACGSLRHPAGVWMLKLCVPSDQPLPQVGGPSRAHH